MIGRALTISEAGTLLDRKGTHLREAERPTLTGAPEKNAADQPSELDRRQYHARDQEG